MPTARRWRAQLILAVAGVVYAGLFVTNTATRARCVQAMCPDTLCRDGAGTIVLSDGCGYYAWLRSVLIDRDLHFENEFTDFNPLGRQYYPRELRTPTGFYPNYWSVGPACVWAGPVSGCHALVSVGAVGDWPADGYSRPYQLTVGVTTLFLGLVTLVLLYSICRHFAEPVAAACAAACTGLGTTLVYYATVEPSMGHGPAAACFAAFCWYWLRGFGRTAPGRWFVLGVLLGASALMRWQLASYVLLPVGEWLWLVCRSRAERPPVARAAALVVCGLAGAALGLAPQLAAWKVVNGGWFAQPITLQRNWLAPDLWNTLCSTDRSFFYWTPLTLVAGIGLLLGLRRAEGRPQLALLLLAVGVQVYALAAVRGAPDLGVYLGASYGHRTLTESCVALAPGLALLFERAGRRAILLALVLVGWNLLLLDMQRLGPLSLGAGATPSELWSAARTFVTWRRTHALLDVVVPVLALALLAAGARFPAAAALFGFRARLLRSGPA